MSGPGDPDRLDLEDVRIFFEREIDEISFLAPTSTGLIAISFNKEELDKLIPWLQSKVTEMG